jgi:tRNA (guanine-N7-)-methyltransferase
LGKKKLERFREMESLDRVYQPRMDEIIQRDYPLKGKWKPEVFGNQHPLVLELGCGKGEYTVGLARMHPQMNFMGIDIKGARMWSGAKSAHIEGLNNVAFLRTRIDFINSFFARNEVEEIWITFPDPQEKRRRLKKRLPGALFLNRYREFLVDGGLVHLKTDNRGLYLDTLELVRYNNLPMVRHSDHLYGESWEDASVNIQTYYEKRFLSEGKHIHYLCFRLPARQVIKEPAHEPD